MRMLVVSPHPDDAEIGVGGTMYRTRQRGGRVTVAVCTGEGDLKMQHSGHTVTFPVRRAEQSAAANLLGFRVEWLELARASRFDETAQSVFVSRFDGLFQGFDRVYLPLPSYNDDHVRVWESGLAAFRPGKLERVELYAYEQPLGWRHDQGQPWFGREYVELNREAVRMKQRAIACHESQVRGREAGASGPGGAALWAMTRGMECGCEFAELTYMVRRKKWW